MTGVSRRRLIQVAPAAVGTFLLAGAAPTVGPVIAEAAPLPHPPKPRPVRPSTPHTPAVPVLHRPVFTLGDYRKVVPGPAFPTDAIALTIDDGPNPHWTPQVLRLLDKYHVPALFCMIGNQVLGHEGVARSVVADGHQVANHTWSHPLVMSRETPGQIRKEIDEAQGKIYSTTGFLPTLFRSPGGDWSPALFAEAARQGMIPIDWSDDPRDWSRPGVPAIVSRLLGARPGQILLCHDGGGDRSQTYTALQTVIPALQARGYRFVALDGRV